MELDNGNIDVRGDGKIIIYKRPTRKETLTSTWHMRIRTPISTGYFRGSTNETNQSNAERVALNKFDELYAKVKGGGKIQTFPISKLFNEWSKYWLTTSTQKEDRYKEHKISNVRNYPLKFFVEVMKDIDVDEITDNHISEFVMWRKQNSYLQQNNTKYIPTPSTINTDLTALSLMLDYGVTKGYISTKPKFKRQSIKDNRRPTFTKPEYSTLIKHMRTRAKESPPSVLRDRFFVQQYVLILANTGMRVGEFRTVKYQDLRTQDYEGEKRLILSIDGKTGRRDVVSNKGTETYIKRIYDYRSFELGKPPESNDYVICHMDGKPVKSFRKSFDAILKSIDLTNDSFGRKRTIYSLRHFFATMRLEEEVSPYLLAQNMGTSIEMLRKHYGQIVTERVALELTKTKSDITVKKSENDYPFD